MKTIDAVIEQCEEIANVSKQHTLHMTHFSQSYDEWAEEWTQIAEWLKELKAYRSSSEIPNTCGDAISRQAVIDRINKQREGLEPEIYPQDKIGDRAYRICIDFVERIPSVTPQQRTGRWIEVIDETDSLGNKTWHHECSICGSDKSGWGTYKHCPHCGAKMEVEE